MCPIIWSNKIYYTCQYSCIWLCVSLIHAYWRHSYDVIHAGQFLVLYSQICTINFLAKQLLYSIQFEQKSRPLNEATCTCDFLVLHYHVGIHLGTSEGNLWSYIQTNHWNNFRYLCNILESLQHIWKSKKLCKDKDLMYLTKENLM